MITRHYLQIHCMVSSPPSFLRCADLAREPGSSSQLTVLPIQEHGFHLHKSNLSLRYGITPLNTSKTCHCGTSFLVDHAMVCPFRGFPTIRHNEVQDLSAALLTEVSHNVATEPSLQQVTTDTFSLASANTTNDARLDIKTRGFWSRSQDAYFDVRVFYPWQIPPVTTPLALNLPINITRMPRSVNMVTKIEILNMELSPHWFLPPLAAWNVRPLCSTDA